jgi:hypothetical protein
MKNLKKRKKSLNGSQVSQVKSPPKYDLKLKRLITERDAKRVRAKGKIIENKYFPKFEKIMRIRKYKGATYIEWVHYPDYY